MADVTDLTERRERRRIRDSIAAEDAAAGAGAPATFYFDPSCPFSYLAAERVERRFAAVKWIPVSAAALGTDEPWSDPRVARLLRVLAERRAAELRLPIVWPDHFPPAGTSVLRVAVHAVEAGAGAAFALAASRLAFCGGFELEDPVVLVEAAAAAGIGIDACLEAIENAEHERPLAANARGLMAMGVTQLPAFGVGPRWFAGEASLGEASAWARTPMVATRPG
ncbi:MAG TPA: DsbA family protein [Solirubrobacteraceae bacterium]|jgi:2-hydroxychromene-2-carboxylate isomerase|nr:DsbA family protein [Solirubrobacteraceae bacterium]